MGAAEMMRARMIETLRASRLPWSGLAALSLLVSIAACGEEDRTPFDYTPSVDRVATSGDDSTRMAAVVSPVPPPTGTSPSPIVARFTASLAPPTERSLTGNANVLGRGKSASVTALLQGGDAGITYAGAIKQGTCDRIGSRLADLVPISVDSAHGGTSFSSVSVETEHLLERPHVVVFGRGGSAEVCGSLVPRGAEPERELAPAP